MAAEKHNEAYARRYGRWTEALRRRPWAPPLLGAVNRGIVWVFYGAYGVLLLGACVTSPWKLIALAGVPAAGFALVSRFRARLNAPRPYECCNVVPLIARDGAGASFPSRHAFSAAAIATSWFAASAPVAVALLAATGVLAGCRVLGGVHFPRDVAAGVVLGMVVGAVAAAGSLLLP
ncbi:phosphatase PAP2 family protein [Adlercreutzia sp. R25]|uniref:Phosphatase PAP2 family protein n=1 Tax=Adlercreutzia shanghongiae TaxID=3111773 RepID=A0ABU6IVU1_9ACTN|nr:MULTISPECIES: phosphatase PAP2 family protein [unclassified Adlercreutzia]MEC4272021.1 phosphatase PAP2 family protein [Adlercreutzia sp. R25]MEC4293752.1 phosphatase PAP2 family protein [Adlercreutzia sp. R22]